MAKTAAIAESAVRWLSETEQRSWRALVQTTTGLLAVLDQELQAAHGLTLAEYEVLAIISEADDAGVRMQELAETLHLSPSGVTRRVDGMVRRGLVTRRQCSEDRRRSYAMLTADGLNRLREAAPTHVRGVREHFINQLSERQLASVASALSLVRIDERIAAGGCDDA
ncbi:MAG: MarR family winged helix-turn-helix transcriptional regulator [Acidimicrobiia bacterium]